MFNIVTNEAMDRMVEKARNLQFAIEFETTVRRRDIEHTCDNCDSDNEVGCPTCDRSGNVTTFYYDEESEDYIELDSIECPTCEGHSYLPCPECDGTGQIDGGTNFDWDEIKGEHCGAEMVTGAMSWNRWRLNRTDIDMDIHEHVYTSEITGGHTHIDWSTFFRTNADQGLSTIRNVGRLIFVMNEYLQDLLGTDEDRRDEGYTNMYPFSTLDAWLEEIKDRYECSNMHWFDKYRIINLNHVCRSSCFDSNTIEFRLFDSTDRIDRAEYNVAYAQAFILLADELTEAEVDNLISNLHPEHPELRAKGIHDAVDGIARNILANVLPAHYSVQKQLAI